jgi:hypothetical protein
MLAWTLTIYRLFYWQSTRRVLLLPMLEGYFSWGCLTEVQKQLSLPPFYLAQRIGEARLRLYCRSWRQKPIL